MGRDGTALKSTHRGRLTVAQVREKVIPRENDDPNKEMAVFFYGKNFFQAINMP